MAAEWWKKAVVYQIYPRSFKDSNGDGIGDLNGITEKLDYLKELGVDVIWVSPMYCSPMDDNGYDISDYYKVDPMFGTNDDMDRLLAEAGKRGMKVILDLVVNHCSDEHQWFVKAKQDPDCEEAGYFYFRRKEDGGEPNNWRSNFGGSVWTELPDGRWYFHTFSKKQPDLNWENPKLREKIYEMINWWLEKGVAGFRVDAITFIKKDLTFASRETEDGLRYPIENLTDYPGIGDFLAEMKEKCFDLHDCMTVAEAPGVGEETFRRYAGEHGYFSMIFDFTWENMEGEADKSSVEAVERWKQRILKSQRFTSEIGWNGLFLENHDQSRCVNKYLEKDQIGYAGASAMAVMYFYLYGTPFIYQGQEIGMTNAVWNSIEEMDDVRAKGMYQEALEQKQDPQKVLEYFGELGRDNARTPMQWCDEKNAGFTEGTPWLKVNENYQGINVKAQEARDDSLLAFYRRLTALRHQEPYASVFAEGTVRPVMEELPAVIAYEREWNGRTVTVAVNFKKTEQEIPAIHGALSAAGNPTEGTCLLSNEGEPERIGERYLLKAYQAVVFDGKMV